MNTKKYRYNGWTNWNTWLVNEHFEDELREDYLDNQVDLEIDELAGAIESYVRSYCQESIDDMGNDFLMAIVSKSLEEVNWLEIASNIIVSARPMIGIELAGFEGGIQ